MAKRKQIINGKVFDWSSVTIAMSGCSGIEPTEINYDDSQEKKPIYGKKGKIRGYGTGNRENSVKIKMIREDFNTFLDSLKKTKFYDAVISKITVSYANTGCTTTTDTLTKVTFSKRSLKAAEGSNSIEVEIEGFAVGGIKMDGKEG